MGRKTWRNGINRRIQRTGDVGGSIAFLAHKYMTQKKLNVSIPHLPQIALVTTTFVSKEANKFK